jgi:hypothetical protein
MAARSVMHGPTPTFERRVSTTRAPARLEQTPEPDGHVPREGRLGVAAAVEAPTVSHALRCVPAQTSRFTTSGRRALPPL